MTASGMDPQRIVGRVKHVDTDHLVAYLQIPNGNIIPHHMHEDAEFQPGDVVLIGPQLHDVETAPQELWPEEPWVGVVRLLLSDEVVVDIGGKIRTFPQPRDLDLQEGSTVEGIDSRGLVRVLSDKPVRYFDLSIGDSVSVEHFKRQPSGSLSFDDFGGFSEIVNRARELIELPLKHRDALANIGTRSIKGVLFTGLPGTGKTMLARIIANQAGAQFYEISGPQVLSKWYGQSEELVRKIFDDAATQEQGAIIFFDEIDSLAVQRNDESHEASRRIVGQLLTSMDGFEPKVNVIVVAATNRPQDIDVALRRPGRFDWQIHFPLPSREDRKAILVTSARGIKVGEGLPHDLIAEKTDSWSPAELVAIWIEAGLLAVQDHQREIILEEDYFGGFERVAAQRALIAASQRNERQEAK
jgi:transitional endoplasmic reticulum ATPase